MHPALRVTLTGEAPAAQAAALLALPLTGRLTSLLDGVDRAAGGRLARLVAAGEAKADAGSLALVHVEPGFGLAAERLALVGVGASGEVDEDGLRTAAAAAVRAVAPLGGTLAWGFDPDLPIGAAEQVRAVVEGAVLGGYDPARWKTSPPARAADELVLAGAPPEAAAAARCADVVARWTNRARELVDAPPNEMTPEGLAAAAAALLAHDDVSVEVLAGPELDRLGLGALTTVGRGSANAPRLIVVRRRGAGSASEVLGLVGKAITFDSGGYFLKPQSDIVRQKADMGGGAAVLAAVGAIAELALPLDVVAVVPAAENMIGGAAFRPGDIVTTAAGLTVEVTNPDAEGRLVLADALWYARNEGATRLVDVATLTGAMRAGMGDLYSGVFANDEAWRSQVAAAGEASGDYAWPWPLHRRYRRLLDSPLADLRNTAGRSFGYPIVAAAFLERFAGDAPWAHVDIHSTAYLDEERDYFARGATGAGVRLLAELATRLANR